MARRGPLPWDLKKTYRGEAEMTRSEWALWQQLRRLIPADDLFAQWWLPGSEYRVDFLVDSIRLVIEVDGPSHRGRTGPDRLRPLELRAKGFTVARVSADQALRDAETIATRIAFRVETERIERREVPDDSMLLSSRVPQPI